MEKWRDRKLIYFVEKKIRGWKSEVDIYLQLCPHSIKQKTNTFFSKKMRMCKQKNNTLFLAKIIVYVQVDQKKKNLTWECTKPICKCTWAFPSAQVHKAINNLPSNFILILGRKYFGGPKDKILGPHHFFSFLFTQPNTPQKSFPSYFLSKVFHPP